jgi:hypothetical protein
MGEIQYETFKKMMHVLRDMIEEGAITIFVKVLLNTNNHITHFIAFWNIVSFVGFMSFDKKYPSFRL